MVISLTIDYCIQFCFFRLFLKRESWGDVAKTKFSCMIIVFRNVPIISVQISNVNQALLNANANLGIQVVCANKVSLFFNIINYSFDWKQIISLKKQTINKKQIFFDEVFSLKLIFKLYLHCLFIVLIKSKDFYLNIHNITLKSRWNLNLNHL